MVGPLNLADPRFDERRAAWLEVAAGWKRYAELGLELSPKLDPRTIEMLSGGRYPHNHVNYLVDLVIQSRHRWGSPLELPFVFAAAFFERAGDFTSPPPEVRVTPHGCHVCCYPKLVRCINLLWPDVSEWLDVLGSTRNFRVDALLPACPVCGTPNDLDTCYELCHSHYPNGFTRPGPRLELHRKLTELLAGTRPAQYGVEIPELGDYFLREEPS